MRVGALVAAVLASFATVAMADSAFADVERGVYAGRTEQDSGDRRYVSPATVEISGRGPRVRVVFAEEYYACRSGLLRFSAGELSAAVRASGKIKESGGARRIFGSGRTGVITYSISGAAVSRKVSATLSLHLQLIARDGTTIDDECDTGPVTLRARRGPFFAGQSRQDRPVTIALTPDRKRVKSFSMSWETQLCAPDNKATIGADSVVFEEPERIRAFAGKAVARGSNPDGTSAETTFRFSGSVTGRVARGTFRVVESKFDATGNLIPPRCDTGVVRWSARSATGATASSSSVNAPARALGTRSLVPALTSRLSAWEVAPGLARRG